MLNINVHAVYGNKLHTYFSSLVQVVERYIDVCLVQLALTYYQLCVIYTYNIIVYKCLLSYIASYITHNHRGISTSVLQLFTKKGQRDEPSKIKSVLPIDGQLTLMVQRLPKQFFRKGGQAMYIVLNVSVVCYCRYTPASLVLLYMNYKNMYFSKSVCYLIQCFLINTHRQNTLSQLILSKLNCLCIYFQSNFNISDAGSLKELWYSISTNWYHFQYFN